MTTTKKDAVPVQALLMPKQFIAIGKTIQFFSSKLASRFAAKLFLTPFKYPMPEREKNMYSNSTIERLTVPAINRDIVVYHYGTSQKKVLLCHGWSGSGTQLAKIAESLEKKGYSTISFDAPAHGRAPGKISMMPFFIESVKFLHKKYPFKLAIGHSLGGMSLLKAVSDGITLDKLCIIGTANSITHITKDFVRNMRLKPKVATHLKSYMDGKFGEDLDNYSGAVSAKNVDIPTLVVHDKDDVDVHYSSAKEITSVLKDGTILLTEKLGHRRILGHPETIKEITSFITE
jgi:pimeloyl-ACP methyl ester carboxylesterase